MSVTQSVPVRSSTPIPRSTGVAAIMFAVVGGFIAILAFAFVLAQSVAPAEVGAHPVARALVAAAPLIAIVAAAHLAVGVGMIVEAPFARVGGAVLAFAGVAVSVAELFAIVTGRDPLAAEAVDPVRAAQSGLGIVLVIAACYSAMLVGSLWPRGR